MQTLKDIFKREDERANIRNMVLCISIVVLVVFLTFGLKNMHFAFQQSPTTSPPTVTVDSETNN